jgi:chaperonin GroEL
MASIHPGNIMAKSTKKWQTPGVIFEPRSRQGMQLGINRLVDAIRPTLGPLPRTVVNEQYSKKKPELLDEGAVIARRIIQLPNREEDMGAMYLRQVLWTLHETTGDGTATAAVVFQTIYNLGLRYLTAGGNAMRLRQYLEAAVPVILNKLDEMVVHLHGKNELARLAETICYDPPLAKMLGEIFDIVGEYGRLEIRSGRSRELEREYIEGMYWDGGLFSREMITDVSLGRTSMENPAILISDLEVQDPQDLLPLLDTAIRTEVKSLLLVLKSISERAMSVLLAKPNRERVQVVGVRLPGVSVNFVRQAMQDLAILTGGRPYLQAAGDTLQQLQFAHLGHARRAWADTNFFGIVGGKCDPRQLRQHISRLRSTFVDIDDSKDRKRLQERIGKLLGGTAVLWVGDNTSIAVEARKALAERTAEAMRGSLRDGVVPGGGVALLACKHPLQEKLRQAQDTDERAAYSILLKAIEAPIRTLLDNAGYDPGEILGEVVKAGPGYGFDVVHRQIVDMAQAGLYDTASVVKAIVQSATRGAALALTVDVLVHRKNPPEVLHT